MLEEIKKISANTPKNIKINMIGQVKSHEFERGDNHPVSTELRDRIIESQFNAGKKIPDRDSRYRLIAENEHPTIGFNHEDIHENDVRLLIPHG